MLINVKGHLFTPTKPVCFTHPSRATFFPDEVLPTLTVYWQPPPSRAPQTSPAETIGCDCAPCIISTPSTATSHANALQTCHQHASYLQYSSTVNYLYIVLSSNRLQSSFLEEPSKRHVLLQSLLNTYSTPSIAQANTQLLLQMTVKLQLMFNKNYMLTFYLRHTPSKSPTGETEK